MRLMNAQQSKNIKEFDPVAHYSGAYGPNKNNHSTKENELKRSQSKLTFTLTCCHVKPAHNVVSLSTHAPSTHSSPT